ncbi:hypothetical protein [Schlesneria sp.]|uniref:hypothetical protein n=1 Tax=Schlesneria sp. TaxID=2762018 RepID=UPI002F06AC5B
MTKLFPLVTFDEILLEQANNALLAWGHKMGPINRPMNGSVVSGGGDTAHGLMFEGELVAVTTTSTLIRSNVAARPDLNRTNTIELSRLCSCSPHLCRVALRLWREFVFKPLQIPFAISYQDKKLHTGATYKNDGWSRIGESRSGPDTRSGRQGRSKVIWMYAAD